MCVRESEYLMAPYCHQDKIQTPPSSRKALHKPPPHPPFPDPNSPHFHPHSLCSSCTASSSMLLLLTWYSPAPGPLHFLLPLPGMLFPCFSSFRSQLRCHLLRKALPGHPSKQCSPTPPCNSQTLHPILSLSRSYQSLFRLCFVLT